MQFIGTERFKIKRRLGAGGMGVVYEAFDTDRGVSCALKTLRQVDARALYRFKNEFRALQGVAHENLVSLGELIEAGGEWFFTMELVDGVGFLQYVCGQDWSDESPSEVGASADTLQAERISGTIEPPSAHDYDEAKLRNVLGQLALGLSAVHNAGMVHRDIKPSNIRITPEGRLVLLDFGLVADYAGGDSTGHHVVGTAAYMAPEQATGSAPGPAADWYSVGVLLYEALTGTVPFTGSGIKILMDKQNRAPAPPRARVPDVPADLDGLCVELLRVNPRDRPSYRQVLEALGVDAQEKLASAITNSAFTQTPPFVGRGAELALLHEAYSDTRMGETVVTLVHGESGLGKSELVRQFTEELAARVNTLVVLSGRCYERESVPYKAFDGVADALSRYLVRLTDADASGLLPLRASLLPLLFPVLSRVEVIARAPRELGKASDPQERRIRMFTALRELLIRLSERHPVVIFIDDLQWADADSMTLLSEILHPPDAPPLLLVATTRSPHIEGGSSDPGFGLEQQVDVRHIVLDQLSFEQSRELVSVLSSSLTKQPEVITAIAKEARGHPLFILELVRQVEEHGFPETGTMRLDDALWSRVVRLPVAARTLLEILAVAGAPITREVAVHATRQSPQEFDPAASVLRAAYMARTGGLRETDPIECYHDRVREAVMAHLDERERGAHHRRLAIALERVGIARSDPHALVRHLEAAGDAERAAHHASEAGVRATAAHAFDQAAAFFRKSLALGDHSADSARTLRLRLGEALANTGRGAEAADVFLAAAENADPATRLHCHRQAAEQLLISGHIESGLAAMASLLAELGVPLPATPRRALMSLLWNRLKLRLRGLRWRPKHESEIAQSDLTRLDVYKAVAHGLSMVDTIRGSDFQARSLLLAVRIGEKHRVGRALTMEAAIQSSQGGIKRARQLLDNARDIAKAEDDPYLRAFNTVVEGVICYFEGRFPVAAQNCAEGEDQFSDQPGTSWERSTARLFRLLSVRLMGDIKELRVLYDRYLRDALRRGDRYLETTVRRYCNVVWMAADDPNAARLNLERASWMPPAGVFHLQHWYELEAEADLNLYENTVSYEQFQPQLEKLRRSLLTRIQSVRTLSNWLVGRLALAETHPAKKQRNLALATRMAKKLEKEPSGYPRVWARLLQAGVSAKNNQKADAVTLLETAAQLATEREMVLCRAAALRRSGELRNDERGAAEIQQADEWFSEQGVVNTERLLRVVVPGFETD